MTKVDPEEWFQRISELEIPKQLTDSNLAKFAVRMERSASLTKDIKLQKLCRKQSNKCIQLIYGRTR